jgi:hypothetical protein
MTLTIDGLVGCLKSVSPASMLSEGVSKSKSIPSKSNWMTISVTDETKDRNTCRIVKSEIPAAPTK